VSRAARRGEAGFTLVELLVSLIVMTIGLTGVVMMQGMVQRGNRVSRDFNRASALAGELLEEARTRQDLKTLTLPYEVDYADEEISGVLFQPKLLIKEHPEIENLVWVEVSVSFEEGDDPEKHVARLMLLRTKSELL
jgi:prepilin-type N-terminal cleavage/methylation domain-containing protein